MLTEKQLSQTLNVHPKTLYQWRLRGCPFHFSTGESRYLYDVLEVRAWAEKNSRKYGKD